MDAAFHDRFLSHDQSPLEEAQAVIVPLPFDGTATFKKGAAKAPHEIIRVSGQLEEFEEELEWEPFSDIAVRSLDPIMPGTGEGARDYIERASAAIRGVPASAFLVGIGGEHNVSIPLVDKCLSPGDHVISIDAHPDLRETYNGDKYSHACTMKRLHDCGMNIVQIGIGCTSKEERKLCSRSPRIKQFYAHKLREEGGFSDMIDHIQKMSGRAYLSIDADGLCASIMPEVGTPVPGGLSWQQLLLVAKSIFGNLNLDVRGFDIVEVCPDGCLQTSAFTAAKIIQKALSYRWRMCRG